MFLKYFVLEVEYNFLLDIVHFLILIVFRGYTK